MNLLISLYLKSAVGEIPESRSYQNGIIDIPYRALCLRFFHIFVCARVCMSCLNTVVFKHICL